MSNQQPHRVPPQVKLQMDVAVLGAGAGWMIQQPLNRVEAACTDLAQAGQPVTITAIAAEHRPCPRTLCRNPQIRAVITSIAPARTKHTPLSGLAAEITHLRTAFEAVVGNVRQPEERLRRLERQAERKQSQHTEPDSK